MTLPVRRVEQPPDMNIIVRESVKRFREWIQETVRVEEALWPIPLLTTFADVERVTMVLLSYSRYCIGKREGMIRVKTGVVRSYFYIEVFDSASDVDIGLRQQAIDDQDHILSSMLQSVYNHDGCVRFEDVNETGIITRAFFLSNGRNQSGKRPKVE
jgi:hypothetical protein